MGHSRRARARVACQFAYPKKLVLPVDLVPFAMSRVELWLTTLSAYGCDAFAFHKERTVPLWHNDFGYEAVGLDLLVQRCNAWYARRAQERRIKPGDRVAVLGRGIAVVEIAGDNQVHAVLWNRDIVRIERREIQWDKATCGGNPPTPGRVGGRVIAYCNTK